MTSFFIVSLGCPKNLVDSEKLGRALRRRGLPAADSEATANILVVNTCGFIRAACEESLETLLLAARLKAEGPPRLLVATGCLSGRYAATLPQELPEVDLFFGPLQDEAAVSRAAEQIATAAGVSGPERPIPAAPVLTPAWRAYVKIADGCSNRCAYCTIPAIRGPRRSRPVEDILGEVARLAAAGVREVTLVAQDTTAYGADLRPQESLASLLERLSLAPGPEWLRVLYLHPERLHPEHPDDRLMEVMASGGRVLPYFDMPVQHASGRILAAMGRGPADLPRLVEAIRRRCPEAVLRTSVMVGFPGEGEREFAELATFARQATFDHLGCFVFSPEEGTPAASLRPKISRRVAQRRVDHLMALQAEISQARNQALVGRILPVLVEEAHENTFTARAARHAPEIDGTLLGEGAARPGEMVRVRVISASAYDLRGRLIP
ncbi:MAG: 30S ribosomal protein S12 methylthiotransferase RimO [Pseudomonadota bacterium]